VEDFLKQNLGYCHMSGNLYWVKEGGNSRKLGKPVGSNSERGRKIYKVFGARVNGKDSSFYCHRVIWLLCYGHWPSAQIDHIDGDGCNNRLSNLRLATISENTRNTSKRDFCSSIYKIERAHF